jgi:phage terminase large subunit
VCKKNGRIYVPNGVYQTELTNPELAEEIKPYCDEEIVWCDCAEPKSIKELKSDRENRINAKPVKKGKDSVRHGIKWMQRHEFIIDDSLQWLVNEFSTYAWAQDKLGQPLHPPKPIDDNNHGIDALRYALERQIRRVRASDMAVTVNGDEKPQETKLKGLMEAQSTGRALEMARR